MKTIEAILIAFGESPDVLALADDGLNGIVQQRLSLGDTNPATNEPAVSNSVIIKLPLSINDDIAAIRDVEHWLEKHRTILETTDSQKILEFHTFLDLNTGSRILNVPNSIIQICGDLGLDLATQAIRILSDSESAELRSR